MRIKVICGKTMRDAMTNVVRTLGEDALILSSRAVGKDGYEITAALDDAELADDLAISAATIAPTPLLPENILRSAPNVGVLAWHGLVAEGAELSPRGVEEYVAANFQFKSLSLGREAPPVVVCGAPGSGKTVYVARLATRLVLAGRKPVIITADGVKAGATEQLAACTRLLGIDLIVADSPLLLKSACREVAPHHCIIIDTPGTCDLDDDAMARLGEIRRASRGNLVLVQSAGGDPEEAAESVARYQAIGAGLMVLTRTDCVRRLGGALHAARGRMALVEAGTGSSVIGGAVQLDAASLTRMLIEKRDRYADKITTGAAIVQSVPVKENRVVKSRASDIVALGGIELPHRAAPGPTESKVVSGQSILTRHIAMQAARHG